MESTLISHILAYISLVTPFSLFLPVRLHRRPMLDMRPLACGLLHGDPVRSRRALERCIEVEFEACVECQGIVCDLNHMDLVIPLKVDFTKAILIEEVIGNHEARVILGEDEVVRPSAHTKVDNSLLHEGVLMGTIADIQQTNLARLK